MYLVKYLASARSGSSSCSCSRAAASSCCRASRPRCWRLVPVLIAVKIPGIGVEINGARRWLGAGPLQFQPSELMKLALVLYAAGLLARRPRG